MDSDNPWYEARQLASVDLLRDLLAAWLIAGGVFTALFLI